ncbi:hypothetical protein EIN_096510 [Entamoeba invadens IP1]|uniref:Uncharacterized protein n=1 Tax=Entamoeba invadens IP1 TaxID=370355 RepID=A0A0A1U0J0_ENTIV|nr:hypothetical protein EIN_096510 [Entamoeba invadens IP1]ELP87394.1 hypothetical protein EIN_096510 [Entamoeba invadens IP1]|eukprot:XP_004254165.1 hypothetical protein EIN_096510 [Entamoeba invadens IP1]
MLFVLLFVCLSFAQLQSEQLSKLDKLEQKLIKQVKDGVEMGKVLAELRQFRNQQKITKSQLKETKLKLDTAAMETSKKISKKIQKERDELRRLRIQSALTELKKDMMCVKQIDYENSLESDKDALNLALRTSPKNKIFLEKSMKKAWEIKRQKLGLPKNNKK